MYNVVMGFFYIFFARSFHDLAEIILTGKLDMYLLKPIDAQFQVSLHEPNIPGFVRPIIGTMMVVAVVMVNHLHITSINILLCILVLAITILFLYSVWFFILTLLIWFPRLENLIELVYGITGQGRNPKEVLKPLAGTPLVFLIIPFFLTVALPTQFLLGQGDWQELAIFTAVSIVLFALSRQFWKFALRSYVSGSV